ncbi:hypothetical protein EOPP23_08505 [Endozoicomonas sp. OPT23]|nr:hypothetical protein [Endozoicomonas sp. OPT23]
MWRFSLLLAAYLPLAAHFLRMGEWAAAVPLAILPLFALTLKTLVIRFLQVVLVCGVFLVWLPTAYEIGQMRIATGQPWLRMAAIMAGVMLFSLAASWCAGGIRKVDS